MRKFYIKLSTPIFFVFKSILALLLTIFYIGWVFYQITILSMMTIVSFIFIRDAKESEEEFLFYKDAGKVMIQNVCGLIISIWSKPPNKLLSL